jgi:hypothetical protein
MFGPRKIFFPPAGGAAPTGRDRPSRRESATRPPKKHPREARPFWKRVRSGVARLRSVLEGVTAVGEPLLTGDVGGRGMRGTHLPLSSCDRWHRRVWKTLWEAGHARRDPGQWSYPCAVRGPRVYPPRLGLLGPRRDLALAGLRLVGVEALVNGSVAVVQQALDQTRQLVGRGGAGLGGPEARLHPPQAGPEGPLRGGHTAGRKAPATRWLSLFLPHMWRHSRRSP